MSLARLDLIMRRADRGLESLAREQRQVAAAALQIALQRILRDVRVAYVQALAMRPTDLQPGAAFRLTRALAIADEIEGALRTLAEPTLYLEGLAAQVATARAQAQGITTAVLSEFGEAVGLTTPLNSRAVAAVVRNAGTRLAAHGETAIQRIEQQVVDGLARGVSWQQVSRNIRAETGYLRDRADMIAHTELHSAQADARREVNAMMGVQYVIRYVTDDDRTCGQCAPRQGEVLEADRAVEVLHPRCRCVLAPFDPGWVMDGGLPLDELQALRADTRATMERAGTRPIRTKAPFEVERVPPVWTPEQGLEALMRLAA